MIYSVHSIRSTVQIQGGPCDLVAECCWLAHTEGSLTNIRLIKKHKLTDFKHTDMLFKDLIILFL